MTHVWPHSLERCAPDFHPRTHQHSSPHSCWDFFLLSSGKNPASAIPREQWESWFSGRDLSHTEDRNHLFCTILCVGYLRGRFAFSILSFLPIHEHSIDSLVLLTNIYNFPWPHSLISSTLKSSYHISPCTSFKAMIITWRDLICLFVYVFIVCFLHLEGKHHEGRVSWVF